jgi:hypothetical protein
MGQKDNLTKEYMSDNERFADAFNYFLFGGKQVIKDTDLHEKDPTELISLTKNNDLFAKQKMRDVLKQCVLRTSDDAVYVMMGVENQSNIHYAMAVKNLLYDSLNYATQADNISIMHKKKQDLKGDEFLSHFAKDDHIIPVVTLTIYWGKEKWDGSLRISDMFPPNTPKEIRNYACDYRVNLITPQTINDFKLFKTELGGVLEFISKSDSTPALKQMVAERNGEWKISRTGVDIMNTMTGSTIKPEHENDEVIEVCKGIQGLIDEGRVEGRVEGRIEGRIEGRGQQKNEDFENVTLSIMEMQNIPRADAEKQARLLLKLD